MEEIQKLPCVVCGVQVEVAKDFTEDEDVLCIAHYFTEDVSEEWERDEDE